MANFYKFSPLCDGSNSGDTVGAGLFHRSITDNYSLPQEWGVFSAEVYAIKMALQIPNVSNLVIMTDSASCLLALEAGKCKHPWIQEAEIAARARNVQFCWIHGHCDIDEADRFA